MAPPYPSERNGSAGGSAPNPGPHPSFIQVAKPYMFEQEIQDCMAAIGATEGKEDTVRLQGVTWIDNVRKALQLPVRTYNTASVYYHKFRLVHRDSEYDYRDAAAAALFNACKIEDTLKKSRDILCAAYNMKLPASEQLSSDDHIFESHAKTIVGLERLMLEASGFDFRNRYPQKILMKLVKSCNLAKESVGLKSYSICLDLYRTYAPLKQTTQTMAMSCLELAARLCEVDLASITSDYGFDYDKWATSREEIMETLLDLLDLYIHHRTNTHVGPEHPLDTFIQIRITLNQEATAQGYPRYTVWHKKPAKGKSKDSEASKKNGRVANGSTSTPNSKSPQSPADVPTTPADRGKEGTVRFMLDPGRARDEKSVVKEYFRAEEVEEEIEVYVELEPDPGPELELDVPSLDEDVEDSSQQYSPPPAISIPSTDSSFESPGCNKPYTEDVTFNSSEIKTTTRDWHSPEVEGAEVEQVQRDEERDEERDQELEQEQGREQERKQDKDRVGLEYKKSKIKSKSESKSEIEGKPGPPKYKSKPFKHSYSRGDRNYSTGRRFSQRPARNKFKGERKTNFEDAVQPLGRGVGRASTRGRGRGGRERYAHDTEPSSFHRPPQAMYDSRVYARGRRTEERERASGTVLESRRRQQRYSRYTSECPPYTHNHMRIHTPTEPFAERNAAARSEHPPRSSYDRPDEYSKARSIGSGPRPQWHRSADDFDTNAHGAPPPAPPNGPVIDLDRPVYARGSVRRYSKLTNKRGGQGAKTLEYE